LLMLRSCGSTVAHTLPQSAAVRQGRGGDAAQYGWNSVY